MLAGLASAPPPIPGALEDDPLTSPSFSLEADTDSRSYGKSRKHAKPSGHGAAPSRAAGNGAGHGSGNYPTAGHASAGYAYHAAPPASAEQWYSAPPVPAEAPAPAYGNPYQHSGPITGSPAGGQAAPGHGGYLADPLRVYSPRPYEAPQYAEPASPGYPALPEPRMSAPPLPASGPVPYADGYAQRHYPDQATYPDGYAADGYRDGYQAGYTGDPYAAGGYGPYPSQG